MAEAMGGAGVGKAEVLGALYILLIFAVNLKLLLKSSVLKKKESRTFFFLIPISKVYRELSLLLRCHFLSVELLAT